MPTYEELTNKHPDYDAKEWHKARALHSGGKALLGNKTLLRELFPKHLAEKDKVYEERCKRAFYLPYAAEILNSILAGLFADPLDCKISGKEEGVTMPITDKYWTEFFEDCTGPGGCEKSWVDFLRDQLLTSLLTKTAWTLIDFPRIPDEFKDQTLTAKQEDDLGLSKAYCVDIAPEMVFDWEEDPNTGELVWVNICHKVRLRTDISDNRKSVTETFTVYYRDRWERYQITYDEDKPPQPPDEIPSAGGALHTFGKVPVVRLDVGDELWIANKIMSVAIAHFNLRNALSWAEYKSLFPVMVAFKEGQNVLNPLTENPNREMSQLVGQGYIMSMAAGDRIEFVGPGSEAYEAAMKDLGILKDEMHRVVHQVAMSVDNTGAAMQRSGDSRALDYKMTALLLYALAKLVKEHCLRVLKLIEVGRKETKPANWVCLGMDSYDQTSLTELMNQANVVDTISIPSATFKRLWCFSLAQRLLDAGATQEQLDLIWKELEENITNEEFQMPGMSDMAFGDPMAPPKEDPKDGPPSDKEAPKDVREASGKREKGPPKKDK